MSYFAKVSDSIVVQVISAELDFFETFVDTSPGEWIQTSFNTRGGKHYGQDGLEDSGVALRKNWAGVGFTYDATRDAFIAPQPYPSWTLVEATCQWTAPVARPDDDKVYDWNEDTTAWVEVT